MVFCAKITGIMNTSKIETVPTKLSRLLLQLSGCGTQTVADFSLQQLADEVDASRETIGALLRDFRQQNWIEVRYGELMVLNASPLA